MCKTIVTRVGLMSDERVRSCMKTEITIGDRRVTYIK